MMNLQEWLDKVAVRETIEIDDPRNASFGDDRQAYDIYSSGFDGSYIGHCSLIEKDISTGLFKFLAEHEVTDELTHGVGFSPKEQKWYGWSHRAVYGFGIGSTCKKGDCHYIGSTIEEQQEAAIDFWTEEHHKNVRCEGIIEAQGDRFFDIKWDYTALVPNEKLRNTIGGASHFITPLGRGEWVAKTLEDAKQMAIDFNEGVS